MQGELFRDRFLLISIVFESWVGPLCWWAPGHCPNAHRVSPPLYVNHRTGKCCERHFYFRTGKCCEQTLMSKQPNDTCEQHFYLPSYIGMDCCSVQGPMPSAVWGLKSSTFLVNNEEYHWRPVNGWTKKELHHLLHQGLPAMILSGLFLPPTLWPKTESAVICIALHSQ